jgi:hypothetical protein
VPNEGPKRRAVPARAKRRWIGFDGKPMNEPTELSPVERFELWYIPEPNSGCWLWLGNVSRGRARISTNRRSKMEVAARFAYRLFCSEVEDHIVIRHQCDNPLCVNPDHLLSGSHADNVADKVRRGRQPKGENAFGAKLTDDQVREIRATPRKRGSGVRLARKYGVSDTLIHRIRRGMGWRHLQ